MLNEIGSPTAMADRPDIKRPADVVPELPKDLEGEILKLINWLRSSLQRVTSATGPGSGVKNLPWLGHGVKGFLRKMWYGNHPDNPSHREEVQPLTTRKLTLQEYKELEAILNSCVDETLLCEAAAPGLNQIINQFGRALKQLVLKHVVKNGAVRPPSPQPKTDPVPDTPGDDVRPVDPDRPEEPEGPKPPLEPKDENEKKVSDEILSQKDAWKYLVRKLLDELPELKEQLGEMPNNFSDFRDDINTAMRGEYTPSPLVAMCWRKQELQQALYKVLLDNWHHLDNNEDDPVDWGELPKEMVDSMDDEEMAVLRHVQGLSKEQSRSLIKNEMGDAGQEIIDLVGNDPKTMWDKLMVLVIKGAEGIKKLPATIRVLMKSLHYGGAELSDGEKEELAQAALEGV